MTKRWVQKREDKRPDEEPPGDWLTNPVYWDLCDKHETTFPMGSSCPQCPGSQVEREP